MTGFAALDGFAGGNGLIRLIGHRGARGIMPENTMEGFAFTLGIGVQALEFDVVLSAEGTPMVTHNHRLSHATTRAQNGRWTTGEEPKVASLTDTALRSFDVGGLDVRSVYGQRFPDQAFLNDVRIPTLADLLALCTQPEHADVFLMLELKSDPDVAGNIEERKKLVSAVTSAVRAHDMTGRTVMHSFDWELLDECRAQAPEMPTSYLSEQPQNTGEDGEDSSQALGPDYANLSVSLPQAVKAAGGQMWCPYFKDVSPELVAEAQALDLIVATWTVNEHADIARMIDAGVDGIVTDYPGRVQHCMLNRGLRWLPKVSRSATIG